MIRHFIAIASVIAIAPSVVNAQSLFSTRGLGIQTEGVDARARALGVNGVGLVGLTTSMLNPAEPAGMFRRGVTASFQPWAGSAEFDGEKDEIGGTRFPLIGILYPMRRLTFSIGYSGRFDQSWAIVAEGKELLGTDTIATTDVVRSTGGIGEFKVGAAYYINERLSVGGSLGLHTGNLDRSLTRAFPDSALGLRGFENRIRWDYSGPIAAVGVRWDPASRYRVSASVTWSGTLDANAQEGTATSYSYDMPLRLSAGASGQIGRYLIAALSTTISNYGSGSYAAPGSATATVADRSIEFGGGIEWQELRTERRVFPLRAGFRMAKLPFHAPGESAPSEWAASAGLGLRLVEDDFGPLAVADLGFERGKRSGWEGPAHPAGLSESFWRFTATVSLFGR